MVNSRYLYPTNTTTAATSVTATMAHRSACVIPSMLPNSAASKLRVKFLNLLMSATPSAKLDVVTMPIAASALMLRLRAARFISIADTNPHRLAPRKKLTDRT